MTQAYPSTYVPAPLQVSSAPLGRPHGAFTLLLSKFQCQLQSTYMYTLYYTKLGNRSEHYAALRLPVASLESITLEQAPLG